TPSISNQDRVKALSGMEKVNPSLYPLVVTLIADEQNSKHLEAIQQLRRMRGSGWPLLPLIHRHLVRVIRLLDGKSAAQMITLSNGLQSDIRKQEGLALLHDALENEKHRDFVKLLFLDSKIHESLVKSALQSNLFVLAIQEICLFQELCP